MMRLSLQFLLIGLILRMPGVLSAQQDQASDDMPTVAELVERLSSNERNVRQSTETQLIDRGPQILDQLPEYDAVKSPGVRSALFRIRRDLEDQKIELSLRSSMIPFPDREFTLMEAVEFIREKTGNELRLSASLESPVTPIRFQKAHSNQTEITFWVAVIQLIEKYHLDLNVDENGRGLVFVAGSSKRSYFTSTDLNLRHPGRPMAWRLNKVERKPIAGRDDEELLRFEMQLLWEPRLTPMFVKLSGNQIAYQETIDKEGIPSPSKLIPFSPEAMTELPCHQLPISPAFRVDWMVPAGEKLSAVSFYPKVEVTLAVGRFDFAFQNWDQPRTSLRRGLGVVVRDELRVTDDTVSFLLILLFSERGAPFESHREWLSKNLIELKSGDQTLKPAAQPEKELEADGSVAFRYKFDRPKGAADHWTLHYRFPTSFRSIEWQSSEMIELDDWLRPAILENDSD